MLEDLDYDDSIPLSNIEGEIFDIIVQILNKIKDIYDIDKDKQYEDQVDATKAYLNETSKDSGILAKIVFAANFLDFGILLDASTFVLGLKISEIDSKGVVEKIAKEIEQLPKEIKNKFIPQQLSLIREYFEICLIKKIPIAKNILKASDKISIFYLSPDGKKVVLLLENNTTIIWDVKTGNQIKILDNPLSSVAWSPNGKYLVLVPNDNTIKLWHVDGKEIATLTGHAGSIESVDWSPNGKYLASGSEDNTIKLWNVDVSSDKFGKEIATFTGHAGSIESVAWSPNGKYLASGSNDNTIKLWHVDVSSDKFGEEIETFTGHADSIKLVSLSPNGKYLAFVLSDKKINILNIETSEVKEFIIHDSYDLFIKFSLKGKRFVVSAEGKKGRVMVFDVKSGEKIKTIRVRFSGNPAAEWSSDGKKIVFQSLEKRIIIWTLFDDETWAMLNRVVFEDKKGKLITRLAFEEALYLIAATNAKKNNQPFEELLQKITNQQLIKLIRNCP